MVSLDEYQRFVADGYVDPSASVQDKLFNAALGLCGESGEVADLVKKQLCNNPKATTERFVEEMGDVLWYITHLCSLKNVRLEDVIMYNIYKLQDRYADVYTGKSYKFIKEDK